MTRFTPIRFKSTTAVAALLLPVLSFAATAQTSGFAIEVGPSADGYSPVRVSAHVFGQATDPASTFVRGCQGHVLPEAAGTIFEVTARMETLAFTGPATGLSAWCWARQTGYTAAPWPTVRASRCQTWPGLSLAAT